MTVWRELTGKPLRFLFSSWPFRVYAFLLSGSFIGLILAVIFAAMVTVGTLFSLVLVGLIILVLAALLGIPVAEIERYRLQLVDRRTLHGPHIKVAERGIRPWLRTRLRERATWRELVYLISLALILSLINLAAVAVATTSLMLAFMPALVALVAPDTIMLGSLGKLDSPFDAIPMSCVGVVSTMLSTYLLGVVSAGHVQFARLLLASREEELDRQVVELASSRSRLLNGFEAERRRIERDLHDGAQQRLVALSMALGLASVELAQRGGEPHRLILRAHEEAKQALSEMRDLIHGIHPQVLTDRGLNAAVIELGARCTIPVDVDISLPGRMQAAVETGAYFAVSELLTNMSKHSEATRSQVVGRVAGPNLVVEVTDDGVGGADPTLGTGLQGLVDRLAVVEGTLEWSSPAGGPTTIRMEIPCHLSRCE
ncbi:sensor histidine kinase [Amycolatopsis antarctica]|uniref:histidine kinase n=2 Tax=Amycolatopsis antarctica TaxID=1854586 RepID=A0A263D483_9PSEU|nr:sensor histidine kinase [Amycolatopsis antarctica]